MSYRYFIEDRPEPQAYSREVLFVVEGVDDAIFLESILKFRGEDAGRIEIRTAKGIGGIPDFLKGVTKSPAYTQGRLKGICVFCDADADFGSTQEKVLKAFRNAGLPETKVGGVVADPPHWCGLYLAPEVGMPGMLEDLVLGAMISDRRNELARSAIQEIDPAEVDLDKRSKRVMQIVLALSKGPICSGVGRGIRNGSIDVDPLKFGELNSFLDDFLAYR